MERKLVPAEDPHETLARGVVSVASLESLSGLHPHSRFTCPGIGPGSDAIEARQILMRASFVTETSTGKMFFRLGEEFLSAEVLRLVTQTHPLSDVRTQAAKILASIATH